MTSFSRDPKGSAFAIFKHASHARDPSAIA